MEWRPGTRVMRRRELVKVLAKVPSFERPREELEQYATDVDLVADISWMSYMRGELVDAHVLDLGCGTGRFAVAAALLGAKQVLCIDVDPQALRTAKEAIEELGLNNVDAVAMDVEYLGLVKGRFHVAFQNPPFGIRSRRGLDIAFLKVALENSRIVYSIHKLETMDYVIGAIRSWGCLGEVVGEAAISIPYTYPHHSRAMHKVPVFVVRAWGCSAHPLH